MARGAGTCSGGSPSPPPASPHSTRSKTSPPCFHTWSCLPPAPPLWAGTWPLLKWCLLPWNQILCKKGNGEMDFSLFSPLLLDTKSGLSPKKSVLKGKKQVFKANSRTLRPLTHPPYLGPSLKQRVFTPSLKDCFLNLFWHPTAQVIKNLSFYSLSISRVAKTCQPCQPVGAIFSGRC